MINISRFLLIARHSAKNPGKKLFASTSILAENKDDSAGALPKKKQLPKNPTVAAVFASLNEDEPMAETKSTTVTDKPNINIDDVIMNAKTVNGLLSISESNNSINRKHALKIVSILAEWSSINKVKLTDFENDARFMKLCRILGRTLPNSKNTPNGNNVNPPTTIQSKATKKINGFRTDDLNTVLGVTGDDEAAKLISSITLPQMVKVMTNLAQRKRRSTPLLRSLAYNISSKEDVLDVKQCADVLYAMAVLHFPDVVLTTKLCADIQNGLKTKIEKSSAIGSILTSLALLKYHDSIVLDSLTEWIIKNQDICRTQDISALFEALASLNYLPLEYEEQIKTKLIPSLTVMDFKKSSDYLSFVWSLIALGFDSTEHYKVVLSDNFLEKLSIEQRDGITPTQKMKLLNLNAGASLLLANYDGPLLAAEQHKQIFDVPIAHNKDKQTLVAGMLDALKSLIPENYLTLNKNSNMGFIVDAEFLIDDKCNPLAKDNPNGKKVAIQVHDYHDMCQGIHQHVNGITALDLKLLQKSGYNVISVPYNEFNNSDKLLKRVQYLEKKIKEIASRKN